MQSFISRTFIFVVALAIAFSGFGQENSTPLASSLLWKLEHPELDSASYLFGTVHILCPDDLRIEGRVSDRLKTTGQLVLELDFDDPVIMQNIQSITMFKDGTTARDYLNQEEYELLDRFFTDSLKMPFQMLGTIKPFFLTAMISLNFLKCNPPASWEGSLVELAKQEGMEVIGLETPEQQMSIIDRVPLEKQGKLLVEAVQKYEESREMMEEMYSLYGTEDIEGLDRLTREYMSEEYSEIETDLLQGRNKAWIARIREIVTQRPSFIAVGAAHLPGEEGLIRLLRREGFSVTPVE